MAGMLDWLSFWNKTAVDNKVHLKNPKSSFAPPEDYSGAQNIIVDADAPHGTAAYARYADDYGLTIASTKQLINTYRSIAEFHEVDDAIQQIVDEAIVEEDNKSSVILNLEHTNFSENIKTKIQDEFDYVLKLYQFRNFGSFLFKKWYVDSRMYIHKIIDNKTKELTELRVVDPINMQLFREVLKKDEAGNEVFVGYNDFYKYTPDLDFNNSAYTHGSMLGKSPLKLPKEAITYVPSGLVDCTQQKNVIGYLHRAIKVTNQLKMLEDALVIYRLARAPERRVFYVDVGGLPNAKAKQYVNDIMANMKNRIVYDSSTGKIKNTTAAMSMMEDIYLPRRDGSKGTEVSTLPSGQNLGEIEDIEYFNRKLYKAMRLPKSRVTDETKGQVLFGSSISEIDRDELNFTKFIRRLQVKFEPVLLDPLKHQVLVKKIITEAEWKINSEYIKIDFNKDSYIEESKRLESFQSKLGLLRDADEYCGTYISKEYIYKNILEMTEEEIEHERAQIKAEIAAGDIKIDDDGY